MEGCVMSLETRIFTTPYRLVRETVERERFVLIVRFPVMREQTHEELKRLLTIIAPKPYERAKCVGYPILEGGIEVRITAWRVSK